MYNQNVAYNLNTNIISNTTHSENLKILSNLTEAEAFSLESSKHLTPKNTNQPSSFKTFNLNEKNQTNSDFLQQDQSSSIGYNNISNYQQYSAHEGELELRVRDTTNHKSYSNMYPK